MRKNGVWDNTRIILVSDHGEPLGQRNELLVDIGKEELLDASGYFPLLMVKDFDSKGFTVSSEFMTNADVPTLATNGIIENPINPFTNKEINSNEKTAHEQFVILSSFWRVNQNNGNTFRESRWVSVKDNIWDQENWTYHDEKVVLDKHSAP